MIWSIQHSAETLKAVLEGVLDGQGA